MTATMPKQTQSAPVKPARKRRSWSAGLRIAGQVIGGLAVAVAAAMLLGRVGALEGRVTTVESERDTAIDQASAVSDPVVELCEDTDDVARELDAQGACAAAQQVQAAPPPSPPEQVIVQRDPSQAELTAIIRPLVDTAVTAYLRNNPPRNGTDGRTPTPEEVQAVVVGVVAEVVAAYLQDNPPEEGRDGVDGRTPSADEVRAVVVDVVNAYFEANPPPVGPMCPPGETPQVVSYGLGGPSGTACVIP